MSENPITKLYVLNEDGETYSAIEPSTVAQAVDDETNNDTVQAFIDSSNERINDVSDRITDLESVFSDWSHLTFKYMGEWEATNQTDFSSIDLPVYVGYAYKVIGETTFNGRVFRNGDLIVVTEDVEKTDILDKSKIVHLIGSESAQVKLDSVVIDTLPTYNDLRNYGSAELNSIIIVANDELHGDLLSFYKYVEGIVYDTTVETYADLLNIDMEFDVDGYSYVIDDVNEIVTLNTYIGDEINVPVPYVKYPADVSKVRVMSDETQGGETTYYEYQNNTWVRIETHDASWTYMFSRREVTENVYTVKGSKPTYEDLPSSGNKIGDVWNVLDTGANYVWTEDGWDKLSETVDMSEYAKKSELATVATSGSYTDLSNKPTISNATITFRQGSETRGTITLNQTENASIDFSAGIAQVSWEDVSGKPDFANVATSGDYNDLSNKPVLSDVATSGDYNDLSNKPTIGDATLTIQKNGTTVGTFSANQTTDETINIEADTQVQSDWNQEDDTQPDFIKNKPDFYHPTLFTHQWSDCLKNDIQWLRADNFSWHSGALYEAAMNHLKDDLELIEGIEYYIVINDDNEEYYRNIDEDTVSTSSVNIYAWTNENDVTIYTLSTNPALNDSIYTSTDISSSTQYVVEYNSEDIYEPSLTLQTDNYGDISIDYYRASDGHKICLNDQVEKLMDLYDEYGVAWYYVVDSDFERFKLPRTKYSTTGVRTNVGDYVEAGAPNITGEMRSGGIYSTYGVTGAFTGTEQTTGESAVHDHRSNTQVQRTVFNASKSNSIYGNSDTIQSPATQMYLYFYVGQYTQSAIEQTAGVTTEVLNEKADLEDISNATITFTQSGEVKGTITLNQMNDATIALASGGSGGTVDWSDIMNKPTFANVATTGNYSDLTNTPTIPTITLKIWS